MEREGFAWKNRQASARIYEPLMHAKDNNRQDSLSEIGSFPVSSDLKN
jgi:hypothetical protein